MCITRRHEKVIFAPHEETKTQTRSPARDTKHPPTNTPIHTHRRIQRHHPTSSVRCFRRPHVPEVHGFLNLFYMNWQKLWCVNCLFHPFCVLWYKISVSIHLFKNSYTFEIYSEEFPLIHSENFLRAQNQL
jgi:hypothetical protein